MSEVVVIAIGVIGTILGVSVFVWSTIDTRRKYGNRKRGIGN